jgi:hypothetical protein
MKTITTKHIQQQRELIKDEQAQAQLLLTWTHEDYCIHQFGEYCAFVEALTEGWPAVREDILYSPVFRGFWTSEWATRNRLDFLAFATECPDYHYMKTEYLFIHSHERLLEDEEFMGRYGHLIKIL